jgi:multimeric flavodoxin WrbA
MDAQNTHLSEDANRTLDALTSFYPEVSRTFHRQRILQAAGLFTGAEPSPEIGRQAVVQAFEFLYPSFETFALAVKDPARLSAVVQAQKELDTAKPLIQISRWAGSPVLEFPDKASDVFALLAGPRIGGNTDVLMDAVLAGAREHGSHTEKLCFSNMNLHPCSGCMACKSGKLTTCCSIRDDMEGLYERFQQCDAFVLGFPVYSGRECSHLTLVLDRLFALSDPWGQKKWKKRRGLIVATWGWPSKDLYAPVVHNIAFILRHFGVHTIEIVTGCGFWDAAYAKGTAALDTEKIEAARAAGRALALS